VLTLVPSSAMLSIVGILEEVYVEGGDDSSDGADAQNVEKWTQDGALCETVLAGDDRRR